MHLMRNRVKSVPFFIAGRRNILMAKQKVRATRHNGRKGENGVFKAGHNDRSFDVDTAEHIDSSRSFMNVYWDMYQGYNIADANGLRPERRFSFEEIEKAFKQGKTYFRILSTFATQEEWKIYPKNNRYEVTRSGKVRVVDSKKIVGTISTNGYCVVTDQTQEETQYYRVHRMVMETYNPIENSENFVVDHIDGNRQNNDISNLRWVTQRQNSEFRDENWAEISKNLQKLIEKRGYDWVNRLILLELE